MKSLFLVALILVAGCVQTTTTAPATTVPATTTAQATTSIPITVPANATTTTILAPKEVVVNITAAGFNPSSVEINKGDTVVWTNKGTSPSWPASAFHPTHTVYPESGGCFAGKFAGCSLAQGEKFSFKFDHNGTWGYHDHLNAGNTGKVIVK